LSHSVWPIIAPRCERAHFSQDIAVWVLSLPARDHVRVDEAVLASRVFPDSVAVKPMTGLLA